MKKAFRDIKRGVNKTVLKVPSIEQKVLDATSNESWGPHGTHLSDIAQASRNYHDYQIIMSVVWKRLSDTGKNWRHVYKALTVLEYLVANGSERVIEDIREHGYQISNLASFQYIDSTGRDQGSNVRKKSQSLVALVNDKEKIQEVREKAAASRDKFRQTSGAPGDDRYESQYGSRDEDRNGYGRERDWNNKDSYGRDGEDRYGRDSYGDDEYRRNSQSIDGDYGAKSQSSDRDDGRHSSRGSNAKVEDASPDGSRLEAKVSGQNLGAPPSYDNAVSEGETPPPPPAANTLAAVLSNDSAPLVATTPPPSATTPPPAATTPASAATTPSVMSDKETEGFDFFDPRAAPPAAPSATSTAEVDLFGSLSDSFSSDVLALVPSEPTAPTTQQFDDPFGDGPFRAVPTTDVFSAQQSTSPFTSPSTDVFSSQQSTSPFTEPPQTVAQTTVNDMGFDDGFDPTIDILAGILPLTGPDQVSTQISFPSQSGQPNQTPFDQPNQTPFGQPNQTPFGQPKQTPFDQHKQTRIDQPNQTPFDQPNQTPFDQHKQTRIDQPNQTPFDRPNQTPFGQPNQTPFSQSNQTPFGQPKQTPFEQPNQTLFDQPNQTPFGQPSQTPFDQPKQTRIDQLNQTPFGQPNQTPFDQPTSQTSYPGQFGQQKPQSAFPPPTFPAQGGQSVMPPSFPAAHGGQSELQSMLPSGHPSSQGSLSELSSAFSAQGGQPVLPSSLQAAQGNQSVLPPSFPAAQGNQSVLQPSFPAAQGGQSVPSLGFAGSQNASFGGIYSQPGTVSQNGLYGGFQPQGQPTSAPTPPATSISSLYQQPQLQSNTSTATQPLSVTASTGALAIVPQQPKKEKFETKSTVWTDTLNRGLVNLNIDGSKTNPLSDIGIDFEAINRKEKRMEKPSKTPVTSNVTMGKAMGSGSGIGRAGAGALRPASNPMAGSAMVMGMGSGMGMSAGQGFGGLNQPMGMNNIPQNMGMGMNNGQGFQMQPPPATGFMQPGSYNPMMGRGGGSYGQQPYGGYR